MDEQTKVLISFISAHNKLIELIFVEILEKYENPIEMASKLGDELRDASTRHDPRLPQDMALLTENVLNDILDRVVLDLQRRGHQK